MKKIISYITALILSISLINVTTVKANNDFTKIKSNLISMITGDGVSTTSEQFTKKVKYIHDEANKIDVITINSETEFDKLPILKTDGTIHDSNLNTTFINIYKLALAYKTNYTGSNSLYQKPTVLEKITKILTTTYDKHLKDSEKTYTGNWYFWEISMPQNISKTLILLENELDNEIIKNYLKFMDESLRAGNKDDENPGNIELASSYHTGANLMDISLNRILQGSLKNDNEIITNAIDSLQTAFVKIDPNNLVNGNVDGVYLDDSFIQHHSVAYTGSYGKVFIDKAMQSLSLLKSTEYTITEKSIQFIKTAFEKSFLPIIYQGYVLENVKGRAVSRGAHGYSDGLVFLESLLVFSDYINDNTFRSYAKYIQKKIPTYVKPNFNNLNAFKILDEISTSTLPEKYIDNGFYSYNLMDRDVSIQKNYLFTIARSSNRISKYEYMSKENTMPWLQGDGMHYLYLDNQYQDIHYGNSYFQTINPLELPGTTRTSEIREDIVTNLGNEYNFDNYKEKRNNFLFFPVATNKISGSIKNHEIYFSTMQLGDDEGYMESLNKNSPYLPPNYKTYKNVDGNKSWFMLEDQILVLNSNISHTNRDLTLTTTIDNRQYKKTDSITGSIDSTEFTKDETGILKTDTINRITLNVASRGNIGYYFFNNPKLTVTKEIRTGHSQTVRPINGSTKFETQYFKIQTDQTNQPSLAYVILPNKNKKETQEYTPEMKIIRSDDVHHIEYKGTHAYSFFKESSEGRFNVKQPTLILEKENDDLIDLSISDSTLQANQLLIELDNKYKYEVISKDNLIEVKENLITINTLKQNGKSFNLKIKAIEKDKPIELIDTKTNIKIKAGEDTLPADTKLNVIEIENTLDVDATIFNITLSKNNVSIQPRKSVLVTMPANPSKKVLKVYYLENNKLKEEQKIVNYTVGDDSVTFEATHFSQYAIVYENSSKNTEITNTITLNEKTTNKKDVQTGDNRNTQTTPFLLLIISSFTFILLRRKF